MTASSRHEMLNSLLIWLGVLFYTKTFRRLPLLKLLTFSQYLIKIIMFLPYRTIKKNKIPLNSNSRSHETEPHGRQYFLLEEAIVMPVAKKAVLLICRIRAVNERKHFHSKANYYTKIKQVKGFLMQTLILRLF